MVWSAIAGAATGGAFDIAGGFLSRPDLSQRDLMHEQFNIWDKQMRQRYPLQMLSMKKAGLNPILASGQAPPGPQSPGAPQPFKDPLGEGVSRAGASARSAFLLEMQRRQLVADTKSKEANAVQQEAAAQLMRRQAVTEARRPGLVTQQALQAGSAYQLNVEQAKRTIMETEIARLNITKAQRDNAIAAIQLGLWQYGREQFERVLDLIGLPHEAVERLAGKADELKQNMGKLDTPGQSSAFDQWMRSTREKVFGK